MAEGFAPVAMAPIAPVHAAPWGQHATCPAWSAEHTAVRGQQSPGAPRPAQLKYWVAHALLFCRLRTSAPLPAGDVSMASYTGFSNGATAGSKSAKTSGAASAASGASRSGARNVRIFRIGTSWSVVNESTRLAPESCSVVRGRVDCWDGYRYRGPREAGGYGCVSMGPMCANCQLTLNRHKTQSMVRCYGLSSVEVSWA